MPGQERRSESRSKTARFYALLVDFRCRAESEGWMEKGDSSQAAKWRGDGNQSRDTVILPTAEPSLQSFGFSRLKQNALIASQSWRQYLIKRKPTLSGTAFLTLIGWRHATVIANYFNRHMPPIPSEVQPTRVCWRGALIPIWGFIFHSASNRKVFDQPSFAKNHLIKYLTVAFSLMCWYTTRLN